MSENLEFELEDLLKQVALKEKIENYQINVDRTCLRNNGVHGEFFLGSVFNLSTNETINCAIKRAYRSEPRRTATNMISMFQVENNFYSVVFPALDQLQKDKKVEVGFTQVPKYYFGNVEDCNETIVMENIGMSGYSMIDRRDLLDDEHIRYIFATYGKFHALGYALKDQKVEVFRKVTDVVDTIALLAGADGGLSGFFNDVIRKVLSFVDADMAGKYPHYQEDAFTIFREAAKYVGEFSTITHGDCWSNNMMFKYNEDKSLADMKLLDFQLSRPSSPVHDLSYFFYSGGSKELFLKLDDYLKIYYESFSNFARELGSDPNDIYPFEQLKEDWKLYAKFGVLFACNITQLKLMDIAAFSDMNDDSKDASSQELKINDELFKERVVDIFTHAHETGIL